jgi:hypothetical protein
MTKRDKRLYRESQDAAERRMFREFQRNQPSTDHNPENSYRTSSEEFDNNLYNNLLNPGPLDDTPMYNNPMDEVTHQHTGFFDNWTNVIIFIFCVVLIVFITSFLLNMYGIIEPVSNMIPINNLQYSNIQDSMNPIGLIYT